MIQAFKRWAGKSGRLETLVLTGVLLAVAGLWIFGLVAAKVMEGDTQKFDERVLLALRKPGDPAVPVGPGWTVPVARDLTAFGSAAGLGVVTAVVAGYLALQRRFGLLGFVLASVLSGTALSLVLKEWFRRPRPQVVPHLTDISMSSFPSGHSMLSSVTYLTLAALLARVVPDWKTKIYFLVVASALALLIGCSRVYLGAHYPTDVFAGWCAGSAWALICSLAAHFISSRHLLPRAAELADEKTGGDERLPAPKRAGENGPTGT